jgi:HD-GYP domain-containing protein (c-di-GMP phosphodiesterase class II)
LGIKQIKVDVNELTVGMFISGLDRPWTQTPFPLQGFYIRGLDDIKQLKLHCQFVYIDVAKGPGPLNNIRRLRAATSPSFKKPARAERTEKLPGVAPLKVRRDVYSEVTPLHKEILKARDLHMRVHQAVAEVMKMVDQDHHNIPVQETKRAASAMVDSIIRSPDAFTWLSRVRERDEYTYSHAVRSAVWALLFGRHIGLPKADLDVLATGVLLKDIGKTKIPRDVLEKQNRTVTEQAAYEQFVDHSVDILRQLPDVKPRVVSVVKTHCERVNGSGFPQHLRGDKIPLLGKIAGIVTFYDEITNPRGQSFPMSPSKAVGKLYDVRDIEFQQELVVEFIRAIGLYPTGTLVELSTGEVAVVVEQNFHRRLKPKVMIMMDAHKRRLDDPVYLDLAEKDKYRQDLLDSGKFSPNELERLEIVQDLEPGTYNLDITSVRDIYLARGAKPGMLGAIKRKARFLPRLFGTH